MNAKIILKPGKEAAVKRFHPWIFSGAIGKVEGAPREGDTVEVLTSRYEFLAMGHYLPGSIAVKIFSFEAGEVNDNFWKAKLKTACQLRVRLEMIGGSVANACRLVYSEGDLMPGLIIDYYNGVAVMQAHSVAMHRLLPVFTAALQEIFGKELTAVYDKSSETLEKSKLITRNSKLFLKTEDSLPLPQIDKPANQLESPPAPPSPRPLVPPSPSSLDHFLYGSSGPIEIQETGHRFMVDFMRGQKTGFFLDQRGNRMFTQFYAKGKKVLNAFCYSGAFSVYALKGGATMVHSIDTSRLAIEWTEQNIKLNECDESRHRSEVADVKRFLAETREKYDMIILDPPAFAKTHHVTNNALHAYVHINAEAIKKMNPGGILFTFSCSQPISREMFRSAIQSAAIESGRQVRILHQLSQGPDHPVSIFHPEGEYLKGLILAVD
ncbi:MAG: class I SAM-dependent rRNA methyltransferase [Bacteroidales bacterium]|nr:class I SAM-dependent rRNA methyltransferase [Bacteroidales bacterium]